MISPQPLRDLLANPNNSLIYNYLRSYRGEWIDEIVMAADVGLSLPLTRKHLAELEHHLIERDDSLWRILDNQPAGEVSVEVVELEELTSDEERVRLHLERQVERAFYVAGKALASLRSRRLYRSTHKTFEDYCRDRFGFERRHPYRLIEAAGVVDHLTQLSPNGTQTETESRQTEMCPNGLQILPTSERQVRPLTKLDPDQQRSVWQQAVSSAGGKLPSGRLVKDIVQRIRERTPVPNPYRVGEVCQLIAQDNPDLRGIVGFWCIVS